MPVFENIDRAIANYAQRGLCAVCKRETRRCPDVGACAQRSIPPSSSRYQMMACKICDVPLRGGEYSAHVGACLAVFLARLRDSNACRGRTASPPSDKPDPKSEPCSRAAAKLEAGRAYLARTQPLAGATAAPARTASSTATSSSSSSTGAIPRRVAYGAPGCPTRVSMVSKGTQTTKMPKTTRNVGTDTSKIRIVPGAPYDFIRWNNPGETTNLLELTNDSVEPQSEPLIASSGTAPLLDDLLGLDISCASPSVTSKTTEFEDVLAKLDPLHPGYNEEIWVEKTSAVDEEDIEKRDDASSEASSATTEYNSASDSASDDNTTLEGDESAVEKDAEMDSEAEDSESSTAESTTVTERGETPPPTLDCLVRNLIQSMLPEAMTIGTGFVGDASTNTERDEEDAQVNEPELSGKEEEAEETRSKGNEALCAASPYLRLIRRGVGRGRRARPAYRPYVE